MIVRELITRLGFETDPSGLKKYEWEAKASTGRILGMIDNTSSSIWNSLKGLGASLALGLSISGAVEAIDEINGLRTQISRLKQETDFDFVRQGAKDTGQALSDYAQSFARVANAGGKLLPTQESVAEVLDAVAGGLSLSGASAGEASGALVQFGQALSMGALRAQEFNSLASAGPVLMQKLAESMLGPDGTVGGLRELSQQGKLTSETLIKHLREISPAIRADMQSSQANIGAAMQRIKDDVAVGIGNIDRTFNISGNIARFSDWVRTGVGKVIDSLGGIKPVAETAALALGVFAAALLAIKLPAVLAALVSPFALISAAVVAGGVALQDFWTFLRGGESIIGSIIGPLETFRAHLDYIREAADKVYASVKRIFDFSGVSKVAGKVLEGDFRGAFAEYKKSSAEGDQARKDFFSGIGDVGRGVGNFIRQALGNRDQARHEGVAPADIDVTKSKTITAPAPGRAESTFDRAVELLRSATGRSQGDQVAGKGGGR